MENLDQLIQMGRELQTKMADLESALDGREVSATSGGGMVTAVVNGKGRVKRVQIDPTVVDPRDVEMLEDLVLAAVSEAQNKAQSVYQEEVQKLSGGFPLPMNLPGLG